MKQWRSTALKGLQQAACNACPAPTFDGGPAGRRPERGTYLGGKRVCATKGSTSIANIRAAPSHPVPVPVPFWTDCLVLLQQGDVAAISTDDSILDGLAAQDPGTKIVSPRFTSEPYGLAISKQHSDFVRFVNAVLQRLRANGRWAASYAHWVGTPVPAPPPARYRG